MSTFRAVDDALLVRLIRQAQRRVVFIAPGIFTPVADALGELFGRPGQIEVTVIVDADEDVCRIGFGELPGLEKLNRLAQAHGLYLRSQPGLRVGVLLVDDQTLVWSPTPRSVEPPPASGDAAAVSPNGMLLGPTPGEQIASAVAADGTATHYGQAEIGQAAVTPAQMEETKAALQRNPPIPVDLARVTRVFSTKLQFVELKVTHARLSQRQLSIDSALLNADAKDELQSLIDSKLKAFGELRELECAVPAYVNGQPVKGADGRVQTEPVCEAELESQRRAIERRFLYDIPGFGRLIERDRKAEFQTLIDAYQARLLAHSEGVRAVLEQQAQRIVADAVDLVMRRSEHRRPGTRPPDPEALAESLQASLGKAKGEPPRLSLVFKDVTYEQTQAADFQAKVDKALPASVRRRLGPWYEKFDAARGTRPGAAPPAMEKRA